MFNNRLFIQATNKSGLLAPWASKPFASRPICITLNLVVIICIFPFCISSRVRDFNHITSLNHWATMVSVDLKKLRPSLLAEDILVTLRPRKVLSTCKFQTFRFSLPIYIFSPHTHTHTHTKKKTIEQIIGSSFLYL